MSKAANNNADPRRVLLIDPAEATIQSIYLTEPTQDCLIKTFAGKDYKFDPMIDGKDGPEIYLLNCEKASLSADEIFKAREERGKFDPKRPLVALNVSAFPWGEDNPKILIFEGPIVYAGAPDKDGNLTALPEVFSPEGFAWMEDQAKWEAIVSFEAEAVIAKHMLTGAALREIPKLIDAHVQDVLDFTKIEPGSARFEQAVKVGDRLSELRRILKSIMVTRMDNTMPSPFNFAELWDYDKLTLRALADRFVKEADHDKGLLNLTPISCFHAAYAAKIADPDVAKAKSIAQAYRLFADSLHLPHDEALAMAKSLAEKLG